MADLTRTPLTYLNGGKDARESAITFISISRERRSDDARVRIFNAIFFITLITLSRLRAWFIFRETWIHYSKVAIVTDKGLVKDISIVVLYRYLRSTTEKKRESEKDKTIAREGIFEITIVVDARDDWSTTVDRLLAISPPHRNP